MKMIKNLTSLSKWTAVLALLIASVAAPVMAQETAVKISGRFSMDYLSGEGDLSMFDPDLLAVYYNGHEHTWTLTLHGTSQSHNTNGSYYGTEIHSTSFDLEFFGPDAATLNGIVSKHLAGRSVNVYLQNTYYSDGGGFAIMHVGVGGGVTGQLYFYTGQDMGSLTLFPADADGYPVVRPEPFSIEPDITELSEFEMFSGTGFNMGSLAGPVTFELFRPLPPSLTIRRTGSDTVTVSWPATASNFVLQQNTNSVSSINWSNITLGIQNDGTTKSLVVNPASGTRFYRLVIP